MNLNKSREFFNPDQLEEAIHIIGCGAVGGTIAENLTRMGCTNLHIYDFDIVTDHNIANQIYEEAHIGKAKLEALKEILEKINSEAAPILHSKGWKPEMPLSGYVFLCVDNIELRKQILLDNYNNQNIIAFFDGRMRLTDAQHYAATWNTKEHKDAIIKTMNFTHEEAIADTPISACGTTLSVVYTVRTLAALMIQNFTNKILTDTLYKLILIDLKIPGIDWFPET